MAKYGEKEVKVRIVNDEEVKGKSITLSEETVQRIYKCLMYGTPAMSNKEHCERFTLRVPYIQFKIMEILYSSLPDEWKTYKSTFYRSLLVIGCHVVEEILRQCDNDLKGNIPDLKMKMLGELLEYFYIEAEEEKLHSVLYYGREKKEKLEDSTSALQELIDLYYKKRDKEEKSGRREK